MKLIESVFKIANHFMLEPKFVKVNYDKCKEVAISIKNGYKQIPLSSYKQEDILIDLLANSINYCFWYGESNFRPENSTSEKMYNIIASLVQPDQSISFIIKKISEVLSLERFPLIEERVKHLNEVEKYGIDFIKNLMSKAPDSQGEDLFTDLIQIFPGYASDMFLKRASLFFLEIHRRYGLFPSLVKQLHVPADYAVPKMLKFFGCIQYTIELEEAIKHDILFPKHSLPECEIRSATILACDYIVKESESDISFVDWYFWSRRKECNDKFHLTITTDY